MIPDIAKPGKYAVAMDIMTITRQSARERVYFITHPVEPALLNRELRG